MVSNNGLTALAPPEFDLLDRNFYAGDPWAVYAWLREFDPVHWDEKNGFWWLSLYEDVASVSKQPDIFSSAKGSRSAARDRSKTSSASSLRNCSPDSPTFTCGPGSRSPTRRRPSFQALLSFPSSSSRAPNQLFTNVRRTS
jgi:hypothetical protein